MKEYRSYNSTIVTQGLYLVALFVVIWAVVTQLDLSQRFRKKVTSIGLEKKLGDLIISQLTASEEVWTDDDIALSIDTIIQVICKNNDLDTAKYTVHFYDKDEVNAFALPDGHLVVNLGLIRNVKNQNELVGVLCHEMAHVEQGHIMNKLVKEVGLFILLGLASGGGNVGELLKLFTSIAFDRNQEKEADLLAVDYMLNANVSPEGLADFLYLLDSGRSHSDFTLWISTHPDGKARAEYILEKYKSEKITPKPILSPQSWQRLKEKYKE